jgi:hypothetical protein
MIAPTEKSLPVEQRRLRAMMLIRTFEDRAASEYTLRTRFPAFCPTGPAW